MEKFKFSGLMSLEALKSHPEYKPELVQESVERLKKMLQLSEKELALPHVTGFMRKHMDIFALEQTHDFDVPPESAFADEVDITITPSRINLIIMMEVLIKALFQENRLDAEDMRCYINAERILDEIMEQLIEKDAVMAGFIAYMISKRLRKVMIHKAVEVAMDKFKDLSGQDAKPQHDGSGSSSSQAGAAPDAAASDAG